MTEWAPPTGPAAGSDQSEAPKRSQHGWWIVIGGVILVAILGAVADDDDETTPTETETETDDYQELVSLGAGSFIGSLDDDALAYFCETFTPGEGASMAATLEASNDVEPLPSGMGGDIIELAYVVGC